MSARTKRFGFNKFGGTIPGTIVDDGQKYTSLDRDLLDRLLTQVEMHNHRYVAPTSGLPAGPTLTLNEGGGALRAGRQYYYRVALVDALGNESPASPETSVMTPAILPAPGMPQRDDDETEPPETGTLPIGIHYYALTGLRGPEESTLGAALAVSVVAGAGGVRLLMPAYGDADAFQVWRLSNNDPGYTRVGVVSAGTDTFVDDGAVPPDPCACDPGNQPPTANTGVGAYSITVSLAELALPELTPGNTSVQGWRIYRTVRSGIYPSASLVAFVTELNDELDLESGLVQEYLDVGAPLQNGMPMMSDQNMRFQPYAFDSATVTPDTAGYPDYYPLVVNGFLTVKVDEAWLPLRSDLTIPAGAELPSPADAPDRNLFLVGQRLYVLIDGAWLPVGGSGGMAPVMTSPDGNRWLMSVDDTGALSTSPTAFPGPPSEPQTVVVTSA